MWRGERGKASRQTQFAHSYTNGCITCWIRRKLLTYPTFGIPNLPQWAFLHRWRALPETFVHFLMFIDTFKSFSLTFPVTWYGINYTGTQMTQWDFQNKGKSGWTGTSSFVLEVPLRHLRPSLIYSVPCDRILQRAYWVIQSWICNANINKLILNEQEQ